MIYIYILQSKSGTNEHPIKPFDARICGIFSWHLPPGFFTFKPCNYGLHMKIKSKSGMNGHPISPFDTIIEPWDSPINSPGFYELKTKHFPGVPGDPRGALRPSHRIPMDPFGTMGHGPLAV